MSNKCRLCGNEVTCPRVSVVREKASDLIEIDMSVCLRCDVLEMPITPREEFILTFHQKGNKQVLRIAHPERKLPERRYVVEVRSEPSGIHLGQIELPLDDFLQ